MSITRTTSRKFFLILVSAVFTAVICDTTSAQSPPNIRINNYFTVDQVKRGQSVKAVVEMEIPSGFHIHSNKPLEKFLIATRLQVEAPQGVRVGPVTYPRAYLRNLKFSKNKVSVYEGKATMRFNVTVPASYSSDSLNLKGRLRYQSCNDELCFRPEDREVTLTVRVVK